MQLTTIEIKNFRSIDELTLDFSEHRAIGLVGVNESGKSNILKALSLISPENKPNQSDIRVIRASDNDIEEAFVEFTFELSNEEIDELAASIEKDVISTEGAAPEFLGLEGQQYSFKDFARVHRRGLLFVNLLDQTSDVYTGEVDSAYASIAGKWLIVEKLGGEVTLEVPGEPPKVHTLRAGSLVRVDEYDTEPNVPHAELLTVANLDLLWQAKVRALVIKQLPKGVFWTYDKENLLPGAVPLASFAATPSMCKPLQSMFEIAGVKDIAREIATETARGRNRLDNLFRRVSDRAAAHIREVWKDYKAASIELLLDGENIRISVKDDSLTFDFADRSDGFKRFITFLLLISAKVKTSSLENVLLLIDEPEISLHPAGVRNLRDELLRIANKNLVVYATHSPHMIDRRSTGRHVIVRKENDVTKCELAHEGNVFNEEVLLNSLGVSVFESLRPTNVIFEGWRDKKLFEVYQASTKLHPQLSSLQEWGIAFVQGVKDVRNVVPLLALAGRRVHIVTDHDAPALDARKQFREARFANEWLTYRELEGKDSSALTAEDFIRPAALVRAFATLCVTHDIKMGLTEADVAGSSRLAAMESALRKGGIGQEKMRPLLNELKSLVFEPLVAADIDERYSVAVEALTRLDAKDEAQRA